MSEYVVKNKMNEFLSGEVLKNALNFAAYLEANEMTFNSGVVSYKDKDICYMHLDSSDEYPSPWTIWTAGDYISEHEDVPISEQMKEIAWANINNCGDCGSGCNPGSRKVIFGKVFDNVCSADMDFYKPDAEALECLKKLLEMRKCVILSENQ